MAVIAVQDASDGLTDITFTAATGGGDTIVSGFKASAYSLPVVLVVKNAGASPCTVTVAGHPAVIVPITTGLGVVPVKGLYNGASRNVTYSGVTSVTVGAVRF